MFRIFMLAVTALVLASPASANWYSDFYNTSGVKNWLGKGDVRHFSQTANDSTPSARLDTSACKSFTISTIASGGSPDLQILFFGGPTDTNPANLYNSGGLTLDGVTAGRIHIIDVTGVNYIEAHPVTAAGLGNFLAVIVTCNDPS